LSILIILFYAHFISAASGLPATTQSDLEHFSIRRDLFRVIWIRPSFRHACNSIWQELYRWQKQYFRADEHRNQHSQVRISGALSMSINAIVQIR
jgi:hypothetical protein